MFVKDELTRDTCCKCVTSFSVIFSFYFHFIFSAIDNFVNRANKIFFVKVVVVVATAAFGVVDEGVILRFFFNNT